MVKNLPANAEDMSLISESGRAPGEGRGNLLQYLEIPWIEEPGEPQSTGLHKSQTWLSD